LCLPKLANRKLEYYFLLRRQTRSKEFSICHGYQGKLENKTM
jgi:hypothetical protein